MINPISAIYRCYLAGKAEAVRVAIEAEREHAQGDVLVGRVMERMGWGAGCCGIWFEESKRSLINRVIHEMPATYKQIDHRFSIHFQTCLPGPTVAEIERLTAYVKLENPDSKSLSASEKKILIDISERNFEPRTEMETKLVQACKNSKLVLFGLEEAFRTNWEKMSPLFLGLNNPREGLLYGESNQVLGKREERKAATLDDGRQLELIAQGRVDNGRGKQLTKIVFSKTDGEGEATIRSFDAPPKMKDEEVSELRKRYLYEQLSNLSGHAKGFDNRLNELMQWCFTQFGYGIAFATIFRQSKAVSDHDDDSHCNLSSDEIEVCVHDSGQSVVVEYHQKSDMCKGENVFGKFVGKWAYIFTKNKKGDWEYDYHTRPTIETFKLDPRQPICFEGSLLTMNPSPDRSIDVKDPR
jgi:hypothetical protein